MNLHFRFAIASDLHVALPHTIGDRNKRFHLVEASVPALECVLDRFSERDIDFLLLAGDLTQHGEADNHAWLSKRLATVPFPVYAIPGNHDVPLPRANDRLIGFDEFPSYYRHCGYEGRDQLYYSRPVAPGVWLIGLNSNEFDDRGEQHGRLDAVQMAWLERELVRLRDEFVLVAIHHNVAEHLPGQSEHPMGQRYMLDNAPEVRQLLRQSGVSVVLTGHLHVQDIAEQDGIYDITTGSLVSYPHPYRIVEVCCDDRGCRLQVESKRVRSVPGFPDLARQSREWMGDRSYPFMIRLLTEPPLSLPRAEAEPLVSSLRYFWANISHGDATIDYPEFPPRVREFFQQFSATDANGTPAFIDNDIALFL
jgi:3',5'-cyclic AMP phosphodiesterase CpdA